MVVLWGVWGYRVSLLQLAEEKGFRRKRLARALMLWWVCVVPLSQVNDLLLNYMRKISAPFLAPEGTKASQEDTIIKSKLALGLTILTVVHELSLPACKNNLADLCGLLCLDKVSQQTIWDEIRHIKEAFAAFTWYVWYWSAYEVTNGAGFAASAAACGAA